jgi:hypothetical protein
MLTVASKESSHVLPLLGTPVQLPRHVRLLNLLLFGDGRYPYAVLLCTGLCAGCALYATRNRSGGIVWANIASAAELVVNAVFGYRYCRDRRADELVRELERYGLTARESVQSLSMCARAALAGVAVVFQVQYVVAASRAIVAKNMSIAWAAAELSVLSFNFMQIAVVCAYWAWSNLALYRATRALVAHRLTADDVVGQCASKNVMALLECMRTTSQVFDVNHCVRFITTLVYATALFKVYQEGSSASSFRESQVSWAAALYVTVWLTAAIPGFVTSYFFASVQRKLAAIALERTSAGVQAEVAATALMQRLEACRSVMGMRFAGVPMTVPKAISVGSVIVTLMRYELALGSS